MEILFQNILSRIHNNGAYQFVAPYIINSPKLRIIREAAEEITGYGKNAAAFVYNNPEVTGVFALAIAAEQLHPGAFRSLSMGGCCIAAVVKDVAHKPSSILNRKEMEISVTNGGANWMYGCMILGIGAMAFAAGCANTTQSSGLTSGNPALCAFHGPDNTAVLAFGPDCALKNGETVCTPFLHGGSPSVNFPEGSSWHPVCTHEGAPFSAPQDTVVCPIENASYVHADCHPWGKVDALSFDRLNVDPSAAQAINAANAADSGAIADIVNKFDIVAGETNRASANCMSHAPCAAVYTEYRHYAGNYIFPKVL